jgi:hypothetical protein
MSSNPQTRPRPSIEIHVSDHARSRMRQRAGLKGARVIQEVREALLAGRVSATKPPGVHGPSYSECLYCWNEDRVFALKAVDNGLVVTTVVSRKHAA